MTTTTPDPLTAYREARDRRQQATAAATAAVEAERRAIQDEREARRAAVLSVPCPFCQAPERVPCDWGPGVAMWPAHVARDQAAGVTAP